MPTYKKAYPVKISFLCAQAIVQIPYALANLIHQADRVQRSSAGFHKSFITVVLYSINIEAPICKPSLGGFHAQFIPQRPEYPERCAAYITLGSTMAPVQVMAFSSVVIGAVIAFVIGRGLERAFLSVVGIFAAGIGVGIGICILLFLVYSGCHSISLCPQTTDTNVFSLAFPLIFVPVYWVSGLFGCFIR
jgi:hypothetical protein